MPHTSSAATKPLARLLLTIAASCAMTACADRATESDLALSPSDTLAQTSSLAPVSDAGARLPYFASITLNGTGCPANSWNTWISMDGHTFNTRFSKYDGTIDDGQRVSVKDCNMSVKLHSDTPLTWAVDSLHYDGYAFMDSNVRGFVTFKYYFQGTPVPPLSEEKRIDLTGPVDRSFRFDEAVADANLVWTPCGRDRTLQLVSRIGLQKQQNKGAGYIELSAWEDSGRVTYGLRWRPCVEDARDAGDAGGTPPTNPGSLDAGSPIQTAP